MSEHTTLTEAIAAALRDQLTLAISGRWVVDFGTTPEDLAEDVANVVAARVSTATGDTEEGLTLTVRAGSEPVSALGVVEEFRAHEPFWQDKMTGEPCPRRGNVLCTVTDSGHRHIACHMVSTATGDTAGDDLRDRVTAVLDEYAGSDHPEHLAIRALVDAAPAPVVSRPETTDEKPCMAGPACPRVTGPPGACRPVCGFAPAPVVSRQVVLMTEPHDGHAADETCPGCPHDAPVVSRPEATDAPCTCGASEHGDLAQHLRPCPRAVSLAADPEAGA